MLRRIGLVLGVTVFTGCATPYLGMSQQEFLDNFSSQVAVASLNAQQAVYQDDSGLYYYFSNGRLVQVDRGIPVQHRVQYEILNH